MVIRGVSVEAFDFDGLEIRDYTAGRSGEASLAEVRVAPGACHRRAFSRRSAKLYVLVEGELSITIGDRADVLRNGDAAVVAVGTEFSYANETEADARLLLVHTPAFALEDEVFV
jgi:mannose-6-phosphate isomerase-like protein (cupin superfamily)